MASSHPPICPLERLLLGADGRVAPPLLSQVKFSPDGSSLVTYGSTGYIIVWPLEGGGQLRRVLGGRRMHSKGVYDCAWSADSSMLVSCGEDGDEGLEEAHVYDALTGRVLASLAGEPSHRFIQVRGPHAGESKVFRASINRPSRSDASGR